MKYFISYFLSCSFLFFSYSCSMNDKVLDLDQKDFYSEKEIQDILSWIDSQNDFNKPHLDFNSFPQLQFKLSPSSTDEKLIKGYLNGILRLNQEIINNNKTRDDYYLIAQIIEENDMIDKKGKEYLLSTIELSKKIYTSDIAINLYRTKNSMMELMDACGCDDIYATYITYSIQCQAYGNVWGHCDWASYYYSQYLACLDKEIHCPDGFTYDGANCFSGVRIPPGYTGFIWDNKFYVEPKCY